MGKIYVGQDIRDTITVNEPFKQEIVENSFDEILSEWRENGFYYCNLIIKEYHERGDTIDIYSDLTKGPALVISRLEFEGLKVTRGEHIEKYIDIKTGDTLNDHFISEADEALRGLDYIRMNAPTEIIPEEGYNRAVVKFSLEERPRFEIEGSGGYVPDDDGYAAWYFDAGLRNFFGQGRFARLHADRREKGKEIFRAEYRQPVFWIGRGEAGLNVSTRDYRDRFYEFGLDLDYDIALSNLTTAGMILEWRDIEPVAGQSYRIYGAGARLRSGKVSETRIDNFQASLDWRIIYRARRYAGNADSSGRSYNDTRMELTAELDYPLWNALHINGKTIVNNVEGSQNPLPISELYLFGGPGTVRGYRNDQFIARRLFIGTIEPRLFFGQAGYFYPFFDIGWYEYYDIDEIGELSKNDEFIQGFGLGVRIGNLKRSIKLSFAWGEEVSFDQPRLNIVINDRF